MDQEPDISAQRPEAIRQHIDETRNDLTEKLEALEQKVKDTFADAKRAVVETVETVKQSADSTVQAVKGTVHDTVDSVKEALDPRRQVQRHPWAMLAGSVAAGYVLARLGPRRHPVSRAVIQSSVEALRLQPESGRQLLDFPPAGTVASSRPSAFAQPSVSEQNGFVSLMETLAPELQQLKGLAIGTLMALARDTLKESVASPLGAELERLVDRVTTKLGGVPLCGTGTELPVARACAPTKTGRHRATVSADRAGQ